MKRITQFLCWLAIALPAFASPGAHGPNGEHLDAANTATCTSSVPRVETFTEAFELVGHLSDGELSVLIDRYETNEPVLGGKLEVQFGAMKAQAKFHEDIGDYAIDDESFLKALSAPGKHQLLFTFVTGGESDLLEGTLNVPVVVDHGHPAMPRWAYWTCAAAALLLIGVLLLRRRLYQTKPTRK